MGCVIAHANESRLRRGRTTDTRRGGVRRGRIMLVLTRKIGEKIRIPDRDVLIKVVEIRGNRVRIGINAPETIAILRGELKRQGGAKLAGGERAVAS
jgi:carbon storage regulator CsrA